METFTIDTYSLGKWTSHAYVAYAKLTENSDSSVYAPQAVVPIRAYVAPATTLDVAHVYADANGDGAPSIGDTVTFTSTVENGGTYPLTGIALSDAASDVLGTLPPDATLAPGATLTWDVAHVLTAADFARGTLTYDVTVEADGLVQLSDNGTVASVAFAAFEADLTDSAEGGIAVCVDGKAVAELSPGDEFTVHAPDCAGEQLGGDRRGRRTGGDRRDARDGTRQQHMEPRVGRAARPGAGRRRGRPAAPTLRRVREEGDHGVGQARGGQMHPHLATTRAIPGNLGLSTSVLRSLTFPGVSRGHCAGEA